MPVSLPGGDPAYPLKSVNLSIDGPFQMFGSQNAIVKKDIRTGQCICFGDSPDDSPGYPYRPFGVVTIGPIASPFPFPIPVDSGGEDIPGGDICGFGNGFLYHWFTWALTADGSYYHCVDNANGQQADNTTCPANNPDPPVNDIFTLTATLPFVGSQVVKVATGPGAVYLLRRNGDLWGVGGGFSSGIAGLPGGPNVKTFTLIAQKVIDMTLFDSGGAIVLSDGRLLFCGYNARRRFGTGTIDTVNHTFLCVPSALWQAGGGFKQITVQRYISPLGYGSSLALRNDGTVWFCGSNQHALSGDTGMGIDSSSGATDFQQVPGLPPIKELAANDAAAYAVDEDGNLWVWGSRRLDTGIAGNALGTGPDADEYQQTPAILLTGVKNVHAANDFGYAIKWSEDIYSWGGPGRSNGGNGRVSGDGTMTPQSIGVARPALEAKGVLSGSTPTILLTSD